MIDKYYNRIKDNADHATQKIHFQSYLFIILSIFFYLAYSSNLTEIQLFGATLSLPLNAMLVLAPSALAFIFYRMVNLAKVEDLCYNEMNSLMKEIFEKTDKPLKHWQLTLMEKPTYYTWSAIRTATTNPNFYFIIGQKIIDIAMFVVYVIAFPAIIIYFIYIGYSILNNWTILIFYIPLLFVTFFTVTVYFEKSKTS